MMKCPLCLSPQTTHYFDDQRQNWLYWLCQHCDFVFRDSKSLLPASEERARYETHNNGIESPGYVDFLMPVVKTLLPYLKSGDRGLDFGSGPGPILNILFEREGFVLRNYDPYFEPLDLKNLNPFEFVTCTEVFEHLYSPHREMEIITSLVKAGGFLLFMTQFRKDLSQFCNWSYRMDNTHVGFLNDKSLSWLAQNWGFEILSHQDRIALLRRRD